MGEGKAESRKVKKKEKWVDSFAKSYPLVIPIETFSWKVDLRE